ncbi:MAG TPA: hypothetical protein VGH88_19230, partial [Streptosporangiaceae bacterium]
SPADPGPTLTIRWRIPRRVSRVIIKRPPGASGLTQVLITGSRGQRRGAMIGASGVVPFAPMRTTKLTFTFITDQAPLQVSDVAIPGVPVIRMPATPFRLPCGLGPRITVDGKTVPTRVSGTFADVLTERPVAFTACRGVRLAAGANQVTEPQSDAFDVQDVVIGAARAGRPAAGAGGPAPVAATVRSWTASQRTLRVTAAARSYLEVNENFNAGWRAVLAGRPLLPVRLDGWKQAWMLPAGSAGLVTLTYQPESLYRDAVSGGLAALALIMIVAFGRLRRAPPRAEWAAPGPRGRAPGGRRPWRPGTGRGLRTAAPIMALAVLLPGAGLVLGGYRGALVVPAVAAAVGALAGTWRGASLPGLLGGLLIVAAAVGAAGQRLVFAGDSGLVVSLTSDVIPQLICLIVVGGLAGALIVAIREPED